MYSIAIHVKLRSKGFSHLGHIFIMINNVKSSWHPTKYDYCDVEGWVVRVGIYSILLFSFRFAYLYYSRCTGPVRVNNNYYYCLYCSVLATIVYSSIPIKHYNSHIGITQIQYIDTYILLSKIYKGHYIIQTGNRIFRCR